MVNEKRCLKRDAKIRNIFDTEFIQKFHTTHSYPDTIVITNLLSKGFPIQLKGGYKK